MQNTQKIKLAKQMRRKARVRAKIFGTAKRPRLSVFRSLKGMNVQLIDDEKQKTLVSANSRELKSKAKKIEQAAELGKLVAKKAGDKKIKECVFDKGGYKYHGRVKALAEGAREGGMKF